MNKLKGSVTAKLLAWVLCIISVIGTAALGMLTIVGIEEDLFSKSYNEALQDIYENVNASYSIDAFRNRDSSKYAKLLADHYFKFGIIKSDSLKDIDFNDKNSYTETNLTDEELKTVNPEKLFLYQIVAWDDYSLNGSRSRGYYGDYDDISELDEISSSQNDMYKTKQYLYADICYDVIKGIIYYRANEKYYPVQNVSLQYSGGEETLLYNYSYDFERAGYKLNYSRPITEITEVFIEEGYATDTNSEAIAITEVAEEQQYSSIDISVDEASAGKIKAILEGKGTGSIVNLAELNSTVFNYNNWGILVLDNIRYISGDELTLIDSTNFSQGYVIDEPGYYLNENYTLVVETNIDSTNYWVVSLVPESVPKELTDSKYHQYNWFIDLYYKSGFNILQGLGVSMVVAILSFVFLACAAGYRRNKEEIVLTYVDRVPVDVLSFGVCVIEFLMLLACIYGLEEFRRWDLAYVYLSLLGVAAFIITAIGIWYLLSLCVRVKNGKWWRNSICYWIFSRIRNIFVMIFRNLNLLWKLILGIGAVSFIEFFIIVEADRGTIAMSWMLEKIVFCVIALILAVQMYELQKASKQMAEGALSYKIDTAKMFWECKKHGDNLNKIGEGITKAVDERMRSERFKTELITNVSHDIKTPLTSIINYVDLLEKEELNNEKASEYLEVLDRQSSKLKKLIEDLVEASKASSGSLPVNKERMEAGVFITQTVGEFEEKLSLADLELVIKKPDEQVYIMADGRHLWRVFDNLMNNVCKYAQPGSRVYVTLEASDKQVSITFRNMSKYPLNVSGEELMERFVRGDKSRSTEGHGLGLSIAQSLMKIIDGEMNIIVDGDLFKVVLVFDRYVPTVVCEVIAEKGNSLN